MSEAARLGRWGEAAACAFLEMCGYRLLDRRYRRPGGEIDLVMARGAVVVFVEVKARNRSSPAPAEAWVTKRQLARLRRLARRWIRERTDTPAASYRFDVVAIDFGGEYHGYAVRHLPGVA